MQFYQSFTNKNCEANMKVEELSHASIVYLVSREKIAKRPVDSITKSGDKFAVNSTYYCAAGETVAVSSYGAKIFFDVEEAKIEQALLREAHIKELHKKMCEAIDAYNKAVQHYLYMPISSPE